jgi:N-acetyl-anhydromuramyl-L-alanine amidase AmpD
VRLTFRASPHYRAGRRRVISAVVLHTSGSLDAEATIAWLQEPDSRSSYHYVIDRAGNLTQAVRDEDVAWHAGRSAMGPHETPPAEPNVNEFSLGILLVATHDSGFTDRQMAALYTLLEVLIVKYGILPERVVGHRHVAPGRHLDPDGFGNQFNWSRVHEIAAAAYRHRQQ